MGLKNTFKKLGVLSCLAALSFSVSAETLRILNWEDYMDPEVMAAYTEQTGVKIEETYYDSDEERDNMLEASRGHGFDLILVSGLMLENYIRKGWVKVLPNGFAKEMSHLDSRLWKSYPAAEWYAVPYFWGTLGIAYRSDLVDKPITSWEEFFSPRKDLSGKIAVMDSTRESAGMALKSLGYSMNVRSSTAYDAAINLLRSQGPHVKEYAFLELDENSSLVTGDVVASMMFSGDALMLQEHNENIEYVLPKEGGNIWIDYLVVSSKSDNKDLAWDFVRYINKPKVAAANANYVWYATPNKAAEALMDEEFLENGTIYPDREALKNSEMFENLLPRHMRSMTKSFESIMESPSEKFELTVH